jgi:hypothetical protein
VLLWSTALAHLSDRSPSSPAILLNDVLFDVVTPLCDVDRRRNESLDTEGEPRRHIALTGIVSAIVPELQEMDPDRVFDRPVSRDPDRWTRDLIPAVRKLNADGGRLAGWTAGLEVSYVMELIIHARYDRMPVDDEAFPDFGKELNAALLHLRDPASAPD